MAFVGMISISLGGSVSGCGATKSESNASPAQLDLAVSTPNDAAGVQPGREDSPKSVPKEPDVPAALWEPLLDPELAGRCGDAADPTQQGIGVATFPAVPHAGAKTEILLAQFGNEDPLAVQLFDAKKNPVTFGGRTRRGIPAITQIHADALSPGRYSLVVGRAGQVLGCREIVVRRRDAGPLAGEKKIDRERVWPIDRSWDGAEEALFSAWLKILFDGPTDEDLAWRALHEVTRDPERNLLWNYLGWGEDSKNGLELTPDCADTPYFLRAYYAWKRRLPFLFHRCDRGRANRAPRCRAKQDNLEPPLLRSRWLASESQGEYLGQAKAAHRHGDPAPVYRGSLRIEDPLPVIEYYFSRTVGWGVHTGNGRVAWSDATNDFYPVALTRENLRPGIMYADPYGHILMLVDLRAGSPGAPGVLFAIDGQPDASITRKRFWQGNFLWNPDPKLGGSGFKAFRPVVFDEKISGLRSLGDAEIRKRDRMPSFAEDLTKYSNSAFYDHMDNLITPGVRRPELAMRQLVDALAEATRIRVRSVQNGVDWKKEHPQQMIEMPTGYRVFETTGSWEDYSTPARDLRLLIAMDTVLDFPDKVGRQPAAFGVDPTNVDAAVKKTRQDLERLLSDVSYNFSYVRSDGQEQILSLKELVARIDALEMAYNPNDCPEIRWGAPPQSKEMRSCKRRAPEPQIAKMKAYRPWFKERRRPERGDDGPPI